MRTDYTAKGMFKPTAGRTIATIAMLAVCVVLGSPHRVGAGPTPTEHEIKAGFIYNFAKFIEFPSGAFAKTDAPMIVGFLGDDQFGDTFGKLAKGKTVRGRQLEVRRCQKPRECDGCHILFIGSSEIGNLPSILDKLRDSSVVTIGDSAGFARRGGIIGFVVENNKLGFEINVGAAKRNGLSISSHLLNLAKAVIN